MAYKKYKYTGRTGGIAIVSTFQSSGLSDPPFITIVPPSVCATQWRDCSASLTVQECSTFLFNHQCTNRISTYIDTRLCFWFDQSSVPLDYYRHYIICMLGRLTIYSSTGNLVVCNETRPIYWSNQKRVTCYSHGNDASLIFLLPRCK